MSCLHHCRGFLAWGPLQENVAADREHERVRSGHSPTVIGNAMSLHKNTRTLHNYTALDFGQRRLCMCHQMVSESATKRCVVAV